ncbi:MAG TPA: TonB-dependent receptor [Steroidobacteraceae bacterium]|nr:TonB-dependent receptor [Steroidobacteraceae bacterium]
MNFISSRVLLLAAPLLALPMITIPALAQEQTQPASDQGGALEEIVVTAQRRQESVLQVSDSVQAFTASQLQQSGLTHLTDLQYMTPGYLPTEGSGYTQIFIRGVGNSIYVGADPSVATYIDDVPRIYGSMVNNLIDVERIEVLKGAQGGLYGRNATGGVVNIVTRQPDTGAFAANGLIDYGDYNTFRGAGYLNIPLAPAVAFSMAVERDSHSYYIRNIALNPAPYTAAMFPGGSVLGSAAQTAAFFNSGVNPELGYDDGSFTASDAKLLIKFTDNFKLTIAGDDSIKTDSDGGQLYQTNPANNQTTLTGLLDLFTGANAQLPAGFLYGPSGKFTMAMGLPAPVDLIDNGISATAVWSLPGVDLTSISAYRHQMTNFFSELGADNVPVESVLVRNFKHFTYQELRAVSNDAGPLHFLGGATYLHNDFTGNTQAYVLNPLYTAPLTHVNTYVKDESAYAQVGYDFTQALNLTVSGRYIRETNDTGFEEPVVSAASTTESKFLPSATLSYQLDRGNVYARWARGFKAGGVNPVASPSVFPNPSEGSIFGPEQVDTYEVGYRQALLDGRMQFTTAAFYNNYKDLQVSAHAQPQYEDEIVLAIVNAQSARTWGFEETLQMRVAAPLTLALNAGYLNAEYVNFSIQNNPVLANFNLDDTTMINAPKWQFGAVASLDQPLNGELHLIGTLLESFTDKVIYGPSGNPGVLPEPAGWAYWLCNLRFGVAAADNKWSAQFYANNLFDRSYITDGQSSAALGDQLIWGTPRIMGGEVTFRF